MTTTDQNIKIGQEVEVYPWVFTLSEPFLEIKSGIEDARLRLYPDCVGLYQSEVEQIIMALEVRLRELDGEPSTTN